MIYLDHNATTPIDGRVVEAMRPYLTTFFGNPSSLHKLGRLSRGAIDQARQQVATLVGAQPNQVIFTSGGTESNNFVIKGFAEAHPGSLIAVGATEHPSVTEPLEAVGRRGHPTACIAVDTGGRVCRESLYELARLGLGLISVMLANNETGVIQDIGPITERLSDRKVAMHTDAVQAAGKIPVDFAASGVQLMSISAHKLGGPKGIGALVTDHSVTLEPLIHGGRQENCLRGGTENLAAIVGFGKAAEIAQAELSARIQHLTILRSRLEERLAAIPGVTMFAFEQQRLPNTVQFAAEGMDGEMLVMLLDREGIAVSSGSACASGGGKPSPVLTAMRVSDSLARSAVRISLGPSNTADEINRVGAILEEKLRLPFASVA